MRNMELVKFRIRNDKIAKLVLLLANFRCCSIEQSYMILMNTMTYEGLLDVKLGLYSESIEFIWKLLLLELTGDYYNFVSTWEGIGCN